MTARIGKGHENENLEIYFRWLDYSVIEIGNTASIPLIFKHLKWNMVKMKFGMIFLLTHFP